MRRAGVPVLTALMLTIAACTTATSPPTPLPPVTASSVNPTAAEPTATRLSSARPNSAQQRPGSTPISLSQPPGTYSLQQYVLCGQQFGIFPGGELHIYPAVPKVVTHGPDAGVRFLVVALGADCRHGATVSVAPTGAAKVSSLVFADDGNPLVVTITPQSGKTGVVTFTPASGPPVRTKIE